MLAAVAIVVSNLEAIVDEAVVLLEHADMDADVEDDTNPTHEDAPIAVWTTTLKYQAYTPRCTYCHMDNHTTEECEKTPKSTSNSTGTSKTGYYCGKNGYFSANCPDKARAKEAREREDREKAQGKKNHDIAHASVARGSIDMPCGF